MMKKVFFVNIAIFLSLMVAVEVGSYIIISAYRHFWAAGQSEATMKGASPAFSNTSDSSLFLTNPEILKDFIDFNHDGFAYTDFLMYKLRPFKSRYVNIDETSTRQNGNPESPPQAQRHKTIWVFGSSALFGAWGNADNETMPAHLESILAKKNPTYSVTVRNFGVPNYKIIQEYLRFEYEAAARGVPDAIIIFDGWNDYGAILSGGMNVSGIVHSALSYYWQFHSDKKIISWPVVKKYVLGVFPNTLELMRLSKKYFELSDANKDIKKWKNEYLRKIEAADAEARREFDPGWQVYKQFAESLIYKAKNAGIPIILSQQPFISTFHQKTMLPHEQDILNNWRLNSASLPSKQIDTLTKVESFHLNVQTYLSEDSYNELYRDMNQKIYALSEKHHVNYLDVTSLLDVPGSDPVFMTKVHLASAANRRIAEKFSEQLSSLFP